MMRIGEFALASGLTVKALRHYDDIDLLEPASATSAGYRMYSPTQLRRAVSIRALRDIGLPLDTLAEVLDNPDGADSAVDRHRHLVAQERARQDHAATQGVSLMASLGRDFVVRRRSGPAQSWTGVVHRIYSLELGEVDAPLARLQMSLTEAGHAVTGPWWTTLRHTAESDVVEVVFCLPVDDIPVHPIEIPGWVVESGVLPVRDELFVTLEVPDGDTDSQDVGGEAAHIAIVERAHLEGLRLEHGAVRQVAVPEDGSGRQRIELVIALRPG
ncbi:DNA-binding transcriptional MerR regulator [Rhodococcus sp. 27YEA15]|uniref:MerR family transcriptional regulator n=1 Tax=Rhodococcus sp. 27YEA15 TaxID=3156259 RepID=UPI003C7DA2F6